MTQLIQYNVQIPIRLTSFTSQSSSDHSPFLWDSFDKRTASKMRQSWLSVFNFIILISTSIVVNINGNTVANDNQPPSTEPMPTHSSSGTQPSTTSLTGNNDSTENEERNINDGGGATTDESLAIGGTTFEPGKHSLNQTTTESPTNGSGSNVGPQAPGYQSYPEYDMYLFLILHVEWVNALPGMILNPLCIYVTMQIKPFNPTSLLMISLALADFGSVFIRFVYRQINENKIFTKTECAWFIYLTNLTLTLSNFILVLWTVERMIAVRFPIKFVEWCSMKNTKMALGVALATALLLSIPYYVHSDPGMRGGCGIGEFISQHWSLVDNAYYVWIPMIIIVVSNAVILYSMLRKMKSHTAITQNVDSIEKREREQRKLTRILLTISFSFIIFHIPQIVVMIYENRYPDPTVLFDDQHAFAKLIAYMRLGYEFTLLQNNVNFILYCSTGQKFRHAVMNVVCFWRSKRQPVSDTTT